ncbi:MAG: hypothetical protein ACFFKA_05785 [Candidatus Thorarchaeota archaeon]
MKVKYKLMLVRKEHNGINVIRYVNLKKIESLIRFENRTFQINVEKPTIIQDKFRIFVVDIDSNAQIYLIGNEPLLNPDELDMIVSNKIINEITRGALDTFKDKLINIAMGAIIGAMVAAVILMGYYNNKIDEIYQQFGMISNSTVIVGSLKWLKMAY